MSIKVHRHVAVVALTATAVFTSVCGHAADDARNAVDRARHDDQLIILSIARVIDPSIRKDDFVYKSCQEWKLSKEQVRSFFRLADSISGEERHSSYYSMPCTYEGAVQSGTRVYEYSINAGLHGFLRPVNGPSERASLFGCKVKCVRLTSFADLYEDEEPR
jgi:hypothetical protein